MNYCALLPTAVGITRDIHTTQPWLRQRQQTRSSPQKYYLPGKKSRKTQTPLIGLQVHPSTMASSGRPNATNELPKWLMTSLQICQITAWLMLIGGPVAMAFGGVVRDNLLNECV
jgi:hypothetical protein